jgi:tripartite-type tricarboxylate transporter receptor subunit TctC
MEISKALAAAAVIGVLGVTTVHAQSYPNQPIRLIVPFAPGGGMETAVRSVVQKINESGWPQLIVDNRPGGAGNVAAIATKQAPPDGYTLMLVAISTHAINVSLIPDLKYDPLKDFSPITVLSVIPASSRFPPARRQDRSPTSWRWRKRNPAASTTARPASAPSATSCR